MDHVIPRSRGGGFTWENIVAACSNCNQRKGNRLPKEIGMTPRRSPFRPRFLAVALLGEVPGNEIWAKYITE